MNKFEQEATAYKRLNNASWEHNIETYQGNGTKIDWFLIVCGAFLIGFGLVKLSVIV